MYVLNVVCISKRFKHLNYCSHRDENQINKCFFFFYEKYTTVLKNDRKKYFKHYGINISILLEIKKTQIYLLKQSRTESEYVCLII